MRDQNGVLEDISDVIGFTATTRLVTIFGPGNLLVPVKPHPDHAITMAIGAPAMRRLVAEWGGQVLKLCMNADFHHARLVRAVASMIKEGISTKDVADVVGRTERQVRNLRVEAEEIGLLPLVLRTKGAKIAK
ncbi:hypothetical protein [Thiobacillus denitrificans]|uniref:Mor transcription activator domain-containing protein n=1 Tax=Thiobacillus denitrificans TaxID=36861 RepID=A0A106BHZ3_THIDE|nr:hypothetical protein [Thiobacillus denitrificans]KVW92622.1 hypothetical protein ABW22_15695 [Thiobacillus denitrificans]